MQLKLPSKMKQLNMEDLYSTINLRYSGNCLTACKVTPTNFQLLVLTGHIEAAIELLSRTEKSAVHAVHMAIALNELKMLGVPCNELDPLLSSQPEDDSPVCRLNVLRLIITYVMRFEKTDTYEALNYYCLLRHYKAADGSNLMLKCISEFIVKNCTAEVLSLIFGKTDPCDPFYYSG